MVATAELQTPAPERVWTVPNVLSLLRLLGVPLFLWLALGPHADRWAFGVLAFAGVSDWADGKIARRFNQSSRLGALLDPAADRLYILATIVATLSLLYAFPLLLLSDHNGTVADVARPFGWAFTAWGVALYWWGGWVYLVQVRQLTREPATGESS